jgi:hypothetical protein
VIESRSFSRRSFARASAVAGASLVSGPLLWSRPAIAGTEPVEGLHLQFGEDAARQLRASWLTTGSVSRPRLRLGTPADGLGAEIEAATRTYVDGATASRLSATTSRSTGCGRRASTSMRCCTMALHQSLARSAPGLLAGRRSGSPASATKGPE